MFIYQQQAVALKIDGEGKVRYWNWWKWKYVNRKVKDEMWNSSKIKTKYHKKCYFFQKRKVNSRTSYSNFKEVKKTQWRGNVKTLRRGQTYQ